MSSREVVVDIPPDDKLQPKVTASSTSEEDWLDDPATIRNFRDYAYVPTYSQYYALSGRDYEKDDDNRQDEESPSRTLAFVRRLTKSTAARRFLLFFLPVALALAVPIIITRTIAKNASIGDVRFDGLFVWMEVIWVGFWAAWTLAYLLPFVFQFFAGLVITGSRKYAELLKAVVLPMTLFFWAMLSRTATPVLCVFEENHAGDCDDDWILILRKILLATVASTAMFFVEKILIHILTVNYRQKQFRSKTQEVERITYILSLMYEASRDRFPLFCHEFAYEDHEIHGLGLVGAVTDKSAGQFSTATAGSRFSVVMDNATKRLTGKEVVKRDSALSVVLHALETIMASEALARRLYGSLVAAGQGAIYENDIADILGPARSEEAQDIFHALDKDENGDVSLGEMISLVSQTSRDKKSMRRSVHDIGQVIKSLDNLLCLIVLLAAFLVYATFFNTAVASQITALWGSVAATSFAISGTVQEFLGSCIFIFVKHPYDVGDRVVINNAHLTVEHISLMYSVFRQVDTGSIIQIPNIINNTAWINNFSRSKAMKERYDFSISAKTKFPAIENLKAVLQAFVSAPENKRDYQPNIDVELISVGNLKELQLRVEICQKSNFSNESLRALRRSKFMVALLTALRKHDINSPGGGTPPPVGSWQNPGYSVAITDPEAQQARAEYEAEEEAKRLKKLNGGAAKPETMTDSDNVPGDFAATAKLATQLGQWRKAAAGSKTTAVSIDYHSLPAQDQWQKAGRMADESQPGYIGVYELGENVNTRYRSTITRRTVSDTNIRTLVQPPLSYRPRPGG